MPRASEAAVRGRLGGPFITGPCRLGAWRLGAWLAFAPAGLPWRWSDSLAGRFRRVGRAVTGGPRPSLSDLLVVVAVTTIVGGSIWAVMSDTRYETQCATARFRLSMIRSQITMYRSDHAGLAPASLEQLTMPTDRDGRVGISQAFVCGPYLDRIPENPFNASAHVVQPDQVPPRRPAAAAGWLYDSATGEVWLNHAQLLGD